MFGAFSQTGRHESKKKNVILLQLSRVTKVPKGVWVYAASFCCNIGTKRGWYFPLIALYYGKIGIEQGDTFTCI